MRRSVVLWLAVLLSLATSVHAQAPDTLSFQGFITNPGGTPIDNPSVGMTFRLYRNDTAVWTETHPGVAVENGVFNVLLGGTEALNTVAFNAPLELGITVGGDAEISPRTTLAAAAYAKALPGMYTYYSVDSGRRAHNVVGGGPNNAVYANAVGATIGGGGGFSPSPRPNSVSGDWGTVSGGWGNSSSLEASTVSGGARNTASGNGATVPGGSTNTADGTLSFAAGALAKAMHEGTFVWNGYHGSVDTLVSTAPHQFLIHAIGGVGIGTNAPDGELHVSGGTREAVMILEADTDNNIETDNAIIRLLQDGGTTGAQVGFDELGFGSNNFGIGRRYGSTNHFDTFVIQGSDGDIGIGTNDPGNHRLRVVSSGGSGIPTSTVHAENSSTSNGIAGMFVSNGTDATLIVDNNGSGDLIKAFSTGLRFAVRNNGDVRADGSFASPATDIAEVFEVEGPAMDYEPGDVLVISSRSDRTVERSFEPVSNQVAGVYATKPGVQLGTPVEGRTVPMGVIGVIPTKVSTENGPIGRGDLLVTSSTPGHAMRAQPVLVQGIEIFPMGAILGKALEPFDGVGTAVIDVLVGVR